jgi:hypothetical protein
VVAALSGAVVAAVSAAGVDAAGDPAPPQAANKGRINSRQITRV